jgi:dTDP-4-dehydrorhamnose reductase
MRKAQIGFWEERGVLAAPRRRLSARRALPQAFRRARLLILGCGDVGLRVSQIMTGRMAVTGTGRSARSADARPRGLRWAALDLDAPRDTTQARPHARPQAQRRNVAALARWCIYLAPPPNEGEGDPRLQRFLAQFAGTRLAYVSTSGVYGDCGGAKFDETRPVRPESARGKRRVAAEQLLRRRVRQTAGPRGLAASILRAPGIYGANRLPIERLEKGTPALQAADDVFTNHIHADDLARLCIAALFRARGGRVFHASDDSEMKMGEYFDLVAETFALPRAPRLPVAELRAQVSPALWSFMRESRRLDNSRIKRELRVALRYPTVQSGVSAAHAEFSKTATYLR